MSKQLKELTHDQMRDATTAALLKLSDASDARIDALESRVKSLEGVLDRLLSVTKPPAPIGGSAYNPANSKIRRRSA